MTQTQTPPALSETPSDKPNPYFRNRKAGPKLSRDEARRQGDITNLAFTMLGGRAAAIGFLNEFHAELDGFPLTIAVSSSEGFELVQAAIQRQSAAAR